MNRYIFHTHHVLLHSLALQKKGEELRSFKDRYCTESSDSTASDN